MIDVDPIRLLDAGKVIRYHTSLRLVGQTDADHSWGVTMLAWQIVEIVGTLKFQHPELSLYVDPSDAESRTLLRILKYALCHDTGEIETGDAPMAGKARNPQLKMVLDQTEALTRASIFGFDPMEGCSTPIASLLKLADLLEAIHYIQIKGPARDTADHWDTAIEVIYHTASEIADSEGNLNDYLQTTWNPIIKDISRQANMPLQEIPELAPF